VIEDGQVMDYVRDRWEPDAERMLNRIADVVRVSPVHK
jgi:hypothetical protein